MRAAFERVGEGRRGGWRVVGVHCVQRLVELGYWHRLVFRKEGVPEDSVHVRVVPLRPHLLLRTVLLLQRLQVLGERSRHLGAAATSCGLKLGLRLYSVELLLLSDFPEEVEHALLCVPTNQ